MSRILLNSQKFKHIPSPFNIKNIEIPVISLAEKNPENSSEKTLSFSIEFSGFKKDDLDFISFITRILLDKLDISSSEIISKPTKIRKINTLVSSFVHSKTKNVFEEKTFKNCIQIYNFKGNLDHITKQLNNIAPPGIDLTVEKFNFVTLKELKELSLKRTSIPQEETGFEEQVEQRMKELIEKFK